jgi:hypothetical protein
MAKRTVTSTITKENETPNNYREPHLLFGKQNYIIVLVGILFIALGFILMAGGGSSDPTIFDADAIYSTRRITIAPILVIVGFCIEIYAIVKKA